MKLNYIFEKIAFVGERKVSVKYMDESSFITKTNIIGKGGRFLCDQWFKIIWPFKNSFAIVVNQDKWNFINEKGEVVSKHEWFDSVYNFNENGYAIVKRMNESGDDECNLIDENGNTMSDAWFDDVYNFDESGFAMVKDEEKWNLLKKDRELVSRDKWFDDMPFFYNGLAQVKNSKKFNLVTLDGKLVDEKWFDKIEFFGDDGFEVKRGRKYNLVDLDGKIVSPGKWFDRIGFFDSEFDGLIKVYIGDNGIFVDMDGIFYDIDGEKLPDNQQVNLKKNK